jgi:hypothetical protein
MKDRGYTTVDSRASDSTMAIERATRFVDEIKTKGM